MTKDREMNAATQEEDNMKFLVFNIGNDNYAINIHNVIEIKHYANISITSVMNSPEYLLGVIKLHENVIPIIDFRILCHFDRKDYNEFTVIIVLEVESQQFGIIVDGVSQIVELQAKKIKPATEVKSIIREHFLQGIAVKDNLPLIILDIEKLIANSTFGVSLDGNA